VVGAEHHAADLAGALRRQPGADDLLPDDAAGLSRGLDTAGELQHAERAGQLHPEGQPTGSVQSWHVSVQRELLPKLLVDVAYVGNKSRDIMILATTNQARPNGPAETRPLAGEAAESRASRRSRVRGGGGRGGLPGADSSRSSSRRALASHWGLRTPSPGRAPRDNASGHLVVQNKRQQPRQLSQPGGRVRPLGLRPALYNTPASCGSCRSVKQGTALRLGT
jgi:hypothetical protein